MLVANDMTRSGLERYVPLEVCLGWKGFVDLRLGGLDPMQPYFEARVACRIPSAHSSPS